MTLSRDKDGKAVEKILSFYENDVVPTQCIPGTACVAWFTDLKDLVNLYMYNVDKSKKEDTFYLNKIKIEDYVDIPENWWNFKGLLYSKK